MKNAMKLAPALAGLALASGTAAQAEVQQFGANAFVTRDAVTVDAPPRAVWLALSQPADWWSDSHSWSGDAANMTLMPQAGGCFCETIPAVEDGDTVGLAGSAQHMMVINAVPDKVLRMRGGLGPLQSEPADGVLTITLSPVADGTRIVFEYVVAGTTRFKTPVIAQAVDAVMTEQLTGIATLLDPEAGAKRVAVSPSGAADAEDEADNAGEAEAEASDAEGDVTEPAAGTDVEEDAAPRPTVDEAFADPA